VTGRGCAVSAGVREALREEGYWRDLFARREFAPVFQRQRKARRRHRPRRTHHLRRSRLCLRPPSPDLLDSGLASSTRVVVQLPNVIEFVYLYFALQKIAASPSRRLPRIRFLEVSQFAKLSGAAACVTPYRHGDFDFTEMCPRVRKETPSVRLGNRARRGAPPVSSLSVSDLRPRAEETAGRPACHSKTDPTDPAIFQLSGGTNGVPKLIRAPITTTLTTPGSRRKSAGLPVTRCCSLALPIGTICRSPVRDCRGTMLQGGKVVLTASTKA